MTWTLSELAAVAEIVGLIAIVPSLIFVGVQLQRGNKEARAASLQATMDADREISMAFADHAGTWDKVISGLPLAEGEESRRGIVLYNVLMADSEGRYHQYQTGYLDAQSWEARETTLREVVKLPIYSNWRNSAGGRSHTADFLAILDEMACKMSE